MKKNVLVKIGERPENRERIVPAVYGEDGELLTPETVEQYTVNVPVMEARNVEMTAEEVAELEKLAAEQPAPEPTPEERIAALEKDNAELREAMEALLSGVTA